MSLTDGDVLELGTGVFSTPYLHYECLLNKRSLVSYDNDEAWLLKFTTALSGNHNYHKKPHHDLRYVEKWDDADIERPWDVALIDHSPSERRRADIKRLAKFAKYIVAHDCNGMSDGQYGYSKIYPLFKYKKIWDKDGTHTVVLSNFKDLKDLW